MAPLCAKPRRHFRLEFSEAFLSTPLDLIKRISLHRPAQVMLGVLAQRPTGGILSTEPGSGVLLHFDSGLPIAQLPYARSSLAYLVPPGANGAPGPQKSALGPYSAETTYILRGSYVLMPARFVLMGKAQAGRASAPRRVRGPLQYQPTLVICPAAASWSMIAGIDQPRPRPTSGSGISPSSMRPTSAGRCSSSRAPTTRECSRLKARNWWRP